MILQKTCVKCLPYGMFICINAKQESKMLEYKIRKKKEREGGMGRINLEIPMQDLRDIKLLAVKWRCAGVDEANVSNFVRIAVKRFLENSDVNKFREEMKK